jgi:phage terminase large subunit
MPSDAANFPAKLQYLFEPHRYKIAYGGRGGAKSWGFARALLILAAQKPLRVLCARETQKSIGDSVHTLLKDQINNLGLSSFYEITNHSITGQNGSSFAFIGIRQNVGNMKSFEGCDICWVEEAQTVSKNSWDVLIPTIRKDNSEIWASFNPDLETDETYQRFVVHQDKLPDAAVVKINWQDNPWTPQALLQEMEALKLRSQDDYEHIYEGMCKSAIEGAIYRKELIAMEKEGRYSRVPYDPVFPVNTFWDLGYGDSTSIWFGQSIGFEFRLIDHLSGSLQSLSYYIKQLKERNYIYGTHWLPHDGKAHELGTGRTIQEQMQAVFGQDKVRCARKLSVDDGIAAARAIFSRCWFDKDKCADGVQSLRHYRYELDEDLGTFKRAPLHDWSSHDADAFRTLAVSIKEQERPAHVEHEPPVRVGVWS